MSTVVAIRHDDTLPGVKTENDSSFPTRVRISLYSNSYLIVRVIGQHQFSRLTSDSSRRNPSNVALFSTETLLVISTRALKVSPRGV